MTQEEEEELAQTTTNRFLKKTQQQGQTSICHLDHKWRKYWSHFIPAAAIQTHSVSLWVTLFIRQGDKLLTSPLFSKASADSDTDKDARGKNARWESGGESRCKKRKWQKRERQGGGERGWGMKHLVKISTGVSGSSRKVWKYLCRTTRVRMWG